MTLEHTAVSSGMIPTPGPCFLCATSCSFPSLPTFPRAAGLSFPIFPQSWSFSPFSNANLPEYSSAKTPPGCPGILAAPCFWGGSKSSGADKFLSLSCCHFLSLTPLLCLRTLLEVAAKPSPSFLSCPPAAVGGTKLVLVERLGQQGKLPRQEALGSALSGY